MKFADDFVTVNPIFGGLLKKPLILKFDDDVARIDLVQKGADGRYTAAPVSPDAFADAITTMARALLKFGGLLTGISTGDLRNLAVAEGYKTSLVSIMDVVSLRRRCPALVYPEDAWAKADWYLTYLRLFPRGFQHPL